ncbi:DUF2062 domain-containing protein [Desulfopila sp. IMCC35006]|uniref:DUF2062 domain-containing protein n=1 Tax=Desulfopila sp. IMCC35006 TaxID=2569542 RepID=UPI0010AC4B26|nr:DUF2062 domain-containing protein [Desulfopila sp. IMCC35006]TKB26106.1 DUF2062 domain-containing protein [Desulfopila sp. IMCC35006]
MYYTIMAESPPKKNRRNLLMRTRPVLRWVIKLRSSPRAIAGGLALGTFIAFTPTVGVQLVLAFVAATIFNMNRPAAMIPVWITNPVTVAPIYTFCYWLGTTVWAGPPLSKVSGLFIDIGRTLGHLEFWNIKEQFFAVLQMGKEILIPLLIGSVAIGVVSGILVYVLSLKLLSIFFSRRSQKHLLNHRKDR